LVFDSFLLRNSERIIEVFVQMNFCAPNQLFSKLNEKLERELLALQNDLGATWSPQIVNFSRRPANP